MEFVETKQFQVGLIKNPFVLYETFGERQTVFQGLIDEVFGYSLLLQVFYQILHAQRYLKDKKRFENCFFISIFSGKASVFIFFLPGRASL